MTMYFYDGQIRRYMGQIIRMLSGFKYQAGDGKQTVVPVTYGDLSRQVAHIIRDNSENKVPSAPRIAVYIADIQLDRTRLADSTHVSKVHIRERTFDPVTQTYSTQQGDQYTVERLMPVPYKLKVKADIWATNTDMKLQIMEQIMMLFNPSLEIQTTDNFIDWTSLSVVDLSDITYTSRSIPAGLETEIDIGTMSFETPIWISAPAKVKRMGVIQDIILNIRDGNYSFETEKKITVGGFDIFVYFDQSSNQYYAELGDATRIIESLPEDQQAAWNTIGAALNWRTLLDQYASVHSLKFRAGSSQLFLTQENGHEIVGTVAINELDETKLIIDFDRDTYKTETLITSINYPNGYGYVDAIINPRTFNPESQLLTDGVRYLILDNIGNPDGHEYNSLAWGDLVANSGDIIEYSAGTWIVVFDAAASDSHVYIKNSRTGIQYHWDTKEWTRSFEGEYRQDRWKLIL